MKVGPESYLVKQRMKNAWPLLEKWKACCMLLCWLLVFFFQINAPEKKKANVSLRAKMVSTKQNEAP